MKKNQVSNFGRVIIMFCLLFTLSFFSSIEKANGNLQNIMSIDSPTTNSYASGAETLIGGWALNASGVRDVEVHLNGEFDGKAVYGGRRNDVNQAYPGYPNGENSGFNYKIPNNKLLNAENTIEVRVIGNDGTTNTSFVTMRKRMPRTSIDTPKMGQEVQDEVLIGGWALDASGVKKINILVNGNLFGEANYGVRRSDVGSAYPEYPNASNSGFNFVLNTTDIPRGKNALVIEVHGWDGSVYSSKVDININKKINIMSIDSPTTNSYASGAETLIGGWALNASGVRDVEVHLNGEFDGKAVYGGRRNDVNQAYPGYPNGENSGFNYKIRNTSLLGGENNVYVKVVGNDGSIDIRYFTINTSKITSNQDRIDYSLEKMLSIQYPSDESLLKGMTYLVTDKYRNEKAFISTNSIIFVDRIAVNSGVNVRLSPSIKSDNVLMITSELTPVQMLLESVKGDTVSGSDNWHKILINGAEAFVHSSVVKLYSVPTYTVKENTLVKSDKSLGSHSYGVVKAGDSLNLLSDLADDWIEIKFSNWRLPTIQDTKSKLIPSKAAINDITDVDSSSMIFMDLTSQITISPDKLNSYLSGKGKLENQADAFIEASKLYNINLAYLVAHAILETGHGKSSLANGTTVVNGKVVYNFYGIAAYDNDALNSGSKYAYNMSWFDPASAIKGGAEWISRNYINNSTHKQNTLYKMRWNYSNPGNHQYSTDIEMPSKISNIMFSNLLNISENYKMNFIVPTYN
ncbi:N-acetylglucosaminidase [Proteiniclasticum ruminis]|uniref:N-acetylglucosaminidase n=1 Tax=Proteiniclasticum ruminis TaxID=398199 RepID=UPI0028A69ABF|nr:Ig-like domain-containing protein [Proteiniclasticum ruminis]